MIHFSDEVLKEVLERALFRGNVLKTEFQFSLIEGSFKRIVLLNIDFTIPEIFFFFTTSKIKGFLDGMHPDITGNFVFVPRGKTPDNPNEDMIIDCRKAYPITKEKLLENFRNNKLTSLSPLNEEFMRDINDIIGKSKLISPRIKKFILP